jgi:antitoxin VapB
MAAHRHLGRGAAQDRTLGEAGLAAWPRVTTTRLVNELAKQRGLTKQAAVRLAVQADLDRAAARVPLRERLARLWAEHKLPPATGEAADKAFFDELAGEP